MIFTPEQETSLRESLVDHLVSFGREIQRLNFVLDSVGHGYQVGAGDLDPKHVDNLIGGFQTIREVFSDTPETASKPNPRA